MTSKTPPAKSDAPPAAGETAEEKQARKTQQALDGAAAWAEYKDQEAATRKRTAELRAQRLAREAKKSAPKKKKKG
jgi:hypothetical protein